jgi:hypothetical protein
VPGAAGRADVEEPPAAWAIAMAEVKTTAAAREYTNLSFMGFTVTPWILRFFSELDISEFFKMNLPETHLRHTHALSCKHQ